MTESKRDISHIISNIEKNHFTAIVKDVCDRSQGGVFDNNATHRTRRINEADENEQTMLHYAVKYNRLKIAKYLVKLGADINAQDDYGVTPLHLAVRLEHLEIFKYLIEQKEVDVNTRDAYETILHTAIIWENLEVIRLLIAKGANLERENDNYNTPLGYAIECKNFEIVKCLIKAGAPDAKCGHNLHTAVRLGDFDTTQYLIETGADLEFISNFSQSTVLGTALKRNNLKMVKYLVERGADITGNKESYTPLSMAVKYCDLDTVKYLVEQGADVHAKTTFGSTLLHDVRDIEIAKYLVEERDLDINAIDNEGETPLNDATSKYYGCKKIELIKYLVEKGAYLGGDRNGETLDISAIELKNEQTKNVREALDEIGKIRML